MKKLFLFTIMLSFVLTAQPAVAQKKLNVVTTIGQITDIVTIIGGENIEVTGLMGAGVDPHLYRASEGDVHILSKADVIFYNGLNLEAKLGKILAKMKRDKTIVALGESVPKNLLLDSEDYVGHSDPHVWFNVEHWSLVAQKISNVLIEKDPDHTADYQKNTDKLIARLKTLQTYVLNRSQELNKTQRVLVTAHDAFRYFGKKYDFEVVGLQGISTESEAGTKDVAELADFIAERKIKAIFIESSVPERNIKAVQEAVNARGWNVEIGGELFSDAMGDEGTVEGTYIGMITHNIDTIVGALK